MRWVILKQIQHGVSQLSYHASMESRFCHTKISLLIVFTPRWSNLQYKNLDGHGVYIAPLKFSSLPARRSNFCTVGLVPCDRNTGTHKEWIKESFYLPWSQNGKRRTLFQIPGSHLHLAHPRKQIMDYYIIIIPVLPSLASLPRLFKRWIALSKHYRAGKWLQKPLALSTGQRFIQWIALSSFWTTGAWSYPAGSWSMTFLDLFVRKLTGRGGRFCNNSSQKTWEWAYFKKGMGLTKELRVTSSLELKEIGK